MSKLIGKMAKCQVSASSSGTYSDLWDVAQDVTLEIGVNTYTLNRKKSASGWTGVLLGDNVVNTFSTTIDHESGNTAVGIISSAFWSKTPVFMKVYYTATEYVTGQFYVTTFPISQPMEDAVQGEVKFGLVDGTSLTQGEDES
jgi:predicted secreted protein